MNSFALDQKKQWTPHGLKPRPGKTNTKGKFTDHRGIDCKLYMNVLAAKDKAIPNIQIGGKSVHTSVEHLVVIKSGEFSPKPYSSG